MAYMAAVAPVPWSPPPPELAPVGFLDASDPAGHAAPTPPPPQAPIAIQLQPDPRLIVEADRRRCIELVQLLKDEGAVPSPEDEKKREEVIRELRKIVMYWAKTVACEQGLPQGMATATVLAYGSYTLGAHGPKSDIDVLCIGPCVSTLEYHFFVVLRRILEGRSEVSGLQTIEKAKVPLMRFRFNGIAVDFTYAQLRVIDVVDALKATNTFSPQLLQKIDTRSRMSLSGVRANEQLLRLVPNLEKFQALLRCIKLWARKRGLHCHYLGFFAGIHLAILAAFVCRRYPYASVNGLFAVFFQTFAHWRWHVPVSLHDEPTTYLDPQWRIMPILMPCTPPEFCVSNVTKGSFKKIREELTRGYALTRDPLRTDSQWTRLFEPFPYDQKYQQFLRIALCSATCAELRDWAGWVKSRFHMLILKLERAGIECDPCPLEEVDHTDNDPNVVFYWGLIPPQTSIQVDTTSLKEHFMGYITNDMYGLVKCLHSDVTISVVRQLPKSMCSHMQHCMMDRTGWLGPG